MSRNQAHRLPPKRWEQALFVVCFIGTILGVVLVLQPTT